MSRSLPHPRKRWARDPIKLLENCPILGLGDNVDALYKCMAEDVQWNAYKAFLDIKGNNRHCIGVNDTLQAAQKELEKPSDNPLSLPPKVFFIVAVVNGNRLPGGIWDGETDHEAMAHAALALLLFFQTLRYSNGKPKKAIEKAPDGQADSASSCFEIGLRPAKRDCNGKHIQIATPKSKDNEVPGSSSDSDSDPDSDPPSPPMPRKLKETDSRKRKEVDFQAIYSIDDANDRPPKKRRLIAGQRLLRETFSAQLATVVKKAKMGRPDGVSKAECRDGLIAVMKATASYLETEEDSAEEESDGDNDDIDVIIQRAFQK